MSVVDRAYGLGRSGRSKVEKVRRRMGQMCSKVSRVKSDLRSQALAIESYIEGGAVCRATVVGGALAGFFQAQPPRIVGGDRRADDARGVADDEGHLLGRAERGGDDQIALAFAVVVIGDDDEFALRKGLQDFLNRVGHFLNTRFLCRDGLPGLSRLRQHQYERAVCRPRGAWRRTFQLLDAK